MAHGRGPADHLVGRSGHGVVVGALERLPLARVGKHGLEPAREGERGGVVAGGGHEDVVPEPLGVAHGVDLAVGDDRREVVGRAGPAVLGDLVEYWMKVITERAIGMAGSVSSPRNSGSLAPKIPWVRSIITARPIRGRRRCP